MKTTVTEITASHSRGAVQHCHRNSVTEIPRNRGSLVLVEIHLCWRTAFIRSGN